MGVDSGKEILPQAEAERKRGAPQTMRKAKVTAKDQNDLEAEVFESGGSSSSGTWVVSDACEGFSSGSSGGGSGGGGGRLDCDPGSLRLRSLLQAADRARSWSPSSSSSSCRDCYVESGSEEKEEEEEEERPPKFVTRAASARRFMDRARASCGDPSRAAVGGDTAAAAAATAACQDAEDAEDGAAALSAALEAVLLCPPQVLARSTSCQGQGSSSFLSSLLTPTSDHHSERGEDRHPCSGGDGGGGVRTGGGFGFGDKGDDGEAAEDAVKAALAWSFPVPKLSSVVEESQAEGETAITQSEVQGTRTLSNKWDIVTSSAPGSRSNGMPESADPAAAASAEGCCASDSVVVLSGEREGFAAVGGDRGVSGGGNGEGNRGCPPLAVSSDGGSSNGGGAKANRQESRASADADTLPPSPMVSRQLNAGTPPNVNVCAAAPAASAAADDDDSASVVDGGGGGGGGGGGSSSSSDYNSKGQLRRSSFGSAASSAPSEARSNHRRRWGSMNMGELYLEDGGPLSATALALEREQLLLSVFGRQAGAAELATVGRSNSCHVFLEAAGRIAALPPPERSLLAGLDRTSDDGGGGSGSDNDCGGWGGVDVPSPPPREEENAPTSEDIAAAAGGDRELPPLSRVGGCVEADGEGALLDAAPTTAYRYRRLAGNSGRGWPPQVDPARREEWLCPIEFEAVFGMKFAEFKDLPSWKRVILKQEVHLF